MKRVILVAAAAVASIGIATASAIAAPVKPIQTFTETGACSVSDFTTTTADDCFGLVLNSNDDTTPDTNENKQATFNLETFGSETGLFGNTGYGFIAKSDNGGLSDGLSYSVSGTIASFNYAGDLSGFEYVVYVFKQSNDFAAYLFDKTAAPTSGAFDLSVFPNSDSLSHISIYAGGQTTVVPLPAAGWLMLAGIGGLAALRRKKKA